MITKENNLMIDNNSDFAYKRKWYENPLSLGTLIDFAVIVAVLVLIFLTELNYIPHVQQGFYCGDQSISYPHTGETVKPKTLFSVMFLGPALLLWAIERLRPDGGASGNKIWHWYRSYLVTIATFTMLSQTLKISTGGLRPHFLHTCAPDAAQNCTIGEYIPSYTCLNTGEFTSFMVSDSSLSFPSAHAGSSTFTSLFCTYYIHMRFTPNRKGFLLKPLVMSLSIAWALVVTVSRVVDRRHHWWDCVAGCILGLSVVMYTIIFSCDSFQDTSRTRSLSCVPPIREHRKSNDYISIVRKESMNPIV